MGDGTSDAREPSAGGSVAVGVAAGASHVRVRASRLVRGRAGARVRVRAHSPLLSPPEMVAGKGGSWVAGRWNGLPTGPPSRVSHHGNRRGPTFSSRQPG